MLSYDSISRLDIGYCLPPLAIAAIAGGASATSGLVGGLINMRNTDKTNQANKDINRDYMAWQTQEREATQAYNTGEREAAQAYNDALLEKTWLREDALRTEANEREDTALTRTVADAKSAGLSPLAALQGSTAGNVANVSTAQGASSVGATSHAGSASPIPMQTPVFPSIDMSAAIGAFASQSNLDEISKHNRASEQQAREELSSRETLSNTELIAQSEQFRAKLEQDNDHFYSGLWQSASQFSDELAQREMFHYDELNNSEKQRAFDSMVSTNNQTIELAKQFSQISGVKTVYVPYTSMDAYQKALGELKSAMVNGNRAVLNMDSDEWINSEAASQNSGFSNSANASLGENSSASDSVHRSSSVGRGDSPGSRSWSESLGRGMSRALGRSIGAGAAHSESQGDSYAYDRDSRYLTEKIQQKYGGVLEVPVLVRSYSDFNRDYGYLNSWRKK